MKKHRKKYNYDKDIPLAVFNWLMLAWFSVFFALDYSADKLPPYVQLTMRISLVVLFVIFALLCFKGTSARFIVSSRTDSFGWIVRTGKRINNTARRLAQNYPVLVKKIRLKDSTYKVTITKKYKYHPNPTSVEELD